MDKESAPRAKKPVVAPVPAQLTPEQMQTQQFLTEHPAHPDNLVNMYDSLSDLQKKQGRNWYPSANYLAHHIAQKATENTGRAITADQVAGHIANYSGQTQWHNNIHMAMLAAHGIYPGEHGAGWRSPIDGKGFMATSKQAEISKAINAGQDWRKLLSPVKEGSFGQNISAGGTGQPVHVTDGPPDLQSRDGRIHLTTDRHHVSATHGAYADDNVYKALALQKPENYDRYADMTVAAANTINARDPKAPPIHPVGLQASVWLGQQLANASGGYGDPKAAQRSIKSAASNKARLEGVMTQHGLDHLNEKAPVVGFPGTGGAIALDHDGEIPVTPTYHGMNAHDGRPMDVGPTPEHSKSPAQNYVQQQNAMNKALIQAGMKPNTIKGVPFDPSHGGGNINDYLALASQHGGYDSSHVQASGGQAFPHFHETPVGQSSLAALQQAGMPTPHPETNEVQKLPKVPLVAMIRRADYSGGKSNCPDCLSLAEQSVKENLADEGRISKDHHNGLFPKEKKLVQQYAKSYVEEGMSEPCNKHSGKNSMVRKASSSKFQYDAVSDQFKTSDLTAKFACNCGSKFAPKDFHRCNCGRSYASFDIVSADKTAAKTVRVVRPVKEHRERILANIDKFANDTRNQINETAKFAKEYLAYLNSFPSFEKTASVDPLQAAKNADYIAYLQRRAALTPGEDRAIEEKASDDWNKSDRGDDPDYQSADSGNQEPDHTQSVEINNEFSQGIKPLHDQSNPYFVRTDHSDDAAPVVFDKESKLKPIFVRTALDYPEDRNPNSNGEQRPTLGDLPPRKPLPLNNTPGVVDPNYNPDEFNLHPNVRHAQLPYVRLPKNHLQDIADSTFPEEDAPLKSMFDGGGPKPPQYGTPENPAPVTTRQVAPKKPNGPVNNDQEWNPQAKVGANPTVPRHLDTTQPGGPQWSPTGVNTQQVTAPFGNGSVNNNYGMGQVAGPGIGGGHKVIDPLANSGANLPVGGLQNEIENQLAFDTGSHHSESPGRHRAKKETMEFNEDDFRLGYTHAENDGRLPKTASRSFIEGYAEYLKGIVADRAPGWNTVAPAFAKPEPGVLPTMSDFTDAKPATDDGDYHGVRNDLADKIDRQNDAGQSRDDQGHGINRPTTDTEGWDQKKSSLAHFKTAELAREIAIRSNAV